MLLRRHVAEHVRAVPADDRRPDRRGDVVVPGRDVGDQRPEGVERRAVADLLLPADVHLELVERDVSGSFDHHLHALLPGPQGQFAQRLQLRELRGVRGVRETAGPQAVAETQGDIVLGGDLQDVVVALEQRILPPVVHHPLGQQASAPAHDARDAVLNQGKVLEQHPAVDGHVVDALAGLVLDRREEIVGGQRRHLAVGDRLIDRHGTDRHRARGENRFAGLIDQPARAQVHHRIGAPADRELELRDFLSQTGGRGRVADVGVDLHPGDASDRHRVQAPFEVHPIGRDDQPAGRDPVANRPHVERLALGHSLHLRSDLTGAGALQLCGVTVHRSSLRWHYPDQVPRV